MALKELQSSKPVKPALEAKKMNILYVEDEDLNWEVTLLHLRERYNVQRAKDSVEAFELLKKSDFHAILMDIQLGGSELDGIEITRALRGTLQVVPSYAKGFTLPNVPIIFMTAYAARYSLEDLVKVGGDELIRKPVDFIHLSTSLSRCVLKGVGRRKA